MTAQAQATVPLARTRDGAVIGIDWRRVEGMLPGEIAAGYLCPGDRVVASGVEVVVQSLPTSARPGVVSVQTVTDGGAPIVLERGSGEPVLVVSAGAFDR